jgi:hypothetical protein
MTDTFPLPDKVEQASTAEQTLEAHYIRGYQLYPETPEEIAWAEAASQVAW